MLGVVGFFLSSAGLQKRLEGLGQHLVADLGVGHGPVFLPQVQTQLALVSEVEVTFLTLENKQTSTCRLNIRALTEWEQKCCLLFGLLQIVRAPDSRSRAFLRCGCAGGSLASADGGSVCRRCGTGRAFPPCESKREP